MPIVFTATQSSFMKGSMSGFECPVQGCQIKYAKTVADDAGGFFTLDSQGKPRPLL
jgi:hypothetical protein